MSPFLGALADLRISEPLVPHLWMYGTCRTLACLLASERPRGSNGSLTTLASLSAGMTTGVRSIMRSVSFKALTFGSQFAESWSSMAQLPSFSAGLETVVEGPSGSGSVSLI